MLLTKKEKKNKVFYLLDILWISLKFSMFGLFIWGFIEFIVAQ